MKIFANTTENWKEIKDAVKTAQEYLKDFNVSIKLNKINLDLKDEKLYETTKSWSWFTLKETKSISGQLIRALGVSNGGGEYDYYALIVDKSKSQEKSSLYGQHSRASRAIEVYADKKKTKRHGFVRTTSSLIHEILHALSDELGKEDKLHEYLDKYNGFDEYVKYLKPELSNDILPLVKRKMDALFALAKIIGLNLRMTSGYRSIKEQNELYARGRTKKGNIVTNARGGESMHNYRVAFDIVDRNKGYNLSDLQWKALGIFWNRLGGEWGGNWDFVDKPHFELTLGYKLKDFQTGKVDYSKFS